MNGYVLQRLLGAVPVLFGVTVLAFLFVRMIPGDPARNIAGERANEEILAQVRRVHGLDEPLPAQYARFLGRIAQGDLGTSLQTNEPVTREIAARFPATIELTLCAVLLATVIGVALGIVASLRPGSVLDLVTMGGALVGVSLPVFCLGYVLIIAVGDHMPYAGRLDEGLRDGFAPRTPFYLVEALVRGEWAALRSVVAHLALPALALSTVPLAVVARITRSSMLEVLSQDYVRTARAKGLSRAAVVLRHALRNATIPIVTVLGVQTGYLLGGAVLTETVFAWPGLGRFVVTAIGERDYPAIQGGVLLFATTFVLVNLLVDVLYARLDPRVRLGGTS
ncbi:MAG: ABC transporter permease [Planctomycetes bacterium]|nr:ABC transporter permease [Planctomycetota bacterium]